MSETIETTFDTPTAIRLKVEAYVGDVSIAAGELSTTTVWLHPHGRKGVELAEQFTVEQRGDEVVVSAPKLRDGFMSFLKGGSVDVQIELPVGSSVDAASGSGDVRLAGPLSDVRGASGSGDVTVEQATEAELKSGSGDLTIEVASGGVRAKTGSGDVTVGAVGGRFDGSTGSGDVSVRECRGSAKARTGSGDLSIGTSTGDLELVTGTGDISLGAVQGGDIHARTGTGDVVIGVVDGVAALLDLNTVTGDVDVDLDSTDGPGDAEAQTRLSVHSGSGDIRVARARLTRV